MNFVLEVFQCMKAHEDITLSYVGGLSVIHSPLCLVSWLSIMFFEFIHWVLYTSVSFHYSVGFHYVDII